MCVSKETFVRPVRTSLIEVGKERVNKEAHDDDALRGRSSATLKTIRASREGHVARESY